MTSADAAVAITCIGLILTVIWQTRRTLNNKLEKKADLKYVDDMFVQQSKILKAHSETEKAYRSAEKAYREGYDKEIKAIRDDTREIRKMVNGNKIN